MSAILAYLPQTAHILAGDILSIPSNVKPDSTGYWLNHTLVVKGETEPPIVRAMAARRPDGSELVIARDQTAGTANYGRPSLER